MPALRLSALGLQSGRHVVQLVAEDGTEEPALRPPPEAALLRLHAAPAASSAASSSAANALDKQAEAPKWQAVAEQLASAQTELGILIDIIGQVEKAQDLAVANITKPKPSPQEAAEELVSRIFVNRQALNGAAARLRQGVESLQSHVSREQRLYDDLLRLQRAWRLQRAPRASEYTFAVDLSFPVPWGAAPSSSQPALPPVRPPLIPIQRHPFTMHLPPGLPDVTLLVESCPSARPQLGTVAVEHSTAGASLVYPNSNTESEDHVAAAHMTLSRAQFAAFQQQVFEAANADALVAREHIDVVHMVHRDLEVMYGQGHKLRLRLNDAGADTTIGSLTMPSQAAVRIAIEQAYLQSLWPKQVDLPRRPSAGIKVNKERDRRDAERTVLARTCQVLHHGAVRSAVVQTLEQQAQLYPSIRLRSQAGLSFCVSACAVDIRPRVSCLLIVRGSAIEVAGLTGALDASRHGKNGVSGQLQRKGNFIAATGAYPELLGLPLTLSVSELPTFIQSQVIAHFFEDLRQEVQSLGGQGTVVRASSQAQMRFGTLVADITACAKSAGSIELRVEGSVDDGSAAGPSDEGSAAQAASVTMEISHKTWPGTNHGHHQLRAVAIAIRKKLKELLPTPMDTG
eukprot:jgi/Chlat1/163/Chrsp1S03241